MTQNPYIFVIVREMHLCTNFWQNEGVPHLRMDEVWMSAFGNASPNYIDIFDFLQGCMNTTKGAISNPLY